MQTVHPRACGEHKQLGRLGLTRAGSSPRLRGTQRVINHQAGELRFIPAPAGNTNARPGPAAIPPVHPRACGEHLIFTFGNNEVNGSSPRLRGTLRASAQTTLTRRFIPAPAGNTPNPKTHARHNPVHPRACGEHWHFGHSTVTTVGSSPRLLGTPRQHRRKRRVGRFIPAPAGNTFHTLRGGFDSPVHPRACGEHLPSILGADTAHGSSPRLRGTHTAAVENAVLRRFIPAPAGNTLG